MKPSQFVNDSSDDTMRSLEELQCPFSYDEIASLRAEMEELEIWDEWYFKQREELLQELDGTIASVMHIGTFIWMNS